MDSKDEKGAGPEPAKGDKKMQNAREWIRTDIQSIRQDVERLGLDGAAEYQVRLADDRRESGDERWTFSASEMLEALREEWPMARPQEEWHTTHYIYRDGKTIEVMLQERPGPAYTREEWDTESPADYEVDGDDHWLCQGNPFPGTVCRAEEGRPVGGWF